MPGVKMKNKRIAHQGRKEQDMANIIYIKTCKVCDHYKPGKKGYCDTLGGYQVINVANGCPHFSGEKYAFDRDRAHTVGERPYAAAGRLIPAEGGC